MTLLSRVHATRCAVVECTRVRMGDAEVCRDCMNRLWRHELDRQPDGSYIARRRFVARDLTRSAA